METESFYNFYEIASNELGITTDCLLNDIQSRPRETSERLKAKPLSKIPCVLGNDLILKGGRAAFISKGSDLWDHLDSYFQRVGRQAEFISAPLIEPGGEINDYLIEKINTQLGAIVEKLSAAKRIGRIYEQFQKTEDLRQIAGQFSSIASKFMSTEAMISGFLRALTSETGKDLVTRSTQAAFVAMAILRNHVETAVPHKGDVHQRIVDLGLSVLFQDISHIMDGSVHASEDQRHAEASARIAAGIGLPAHSLETIRNHHRAIDALGRPILTDFLPPQEERVAVVTNAFLKCVSEKHFNLDPDQAIYVLQHYANRRFYDAHCVAALGKMGIGDRKYLILSKSFDFAKHCDKGRSPAIWNISLDFPNRFICRDTSCQHLSSEEIVLYQSIRFKGYAHNFEIPKGEYRKCQKITHLFNQWLLKTFFPDSSKKSLLN
jgi:hypothetical protein